MFFGFSTPAQHSQIPDNVFAKAQKDKLSYLWFDSFVFGFDFGFVSFKKTPKYEFLLHVSFYKLTYKCLLKTTLGKQNVGIINCNLTLAI